MATGLRQAGLNVKQEHFPLGATYQHVQIEIGATGARATSGDKHQLGVIANLLTQLPCPNQDRLAPRRFRICHPQRPAQGQQKVEFVSVAIHAMGQLFEHFERPC
jgi:hypothetical protein